MTKGTLLLSFDQVDSLLPIGGYLEAVEEAYASSVNGSALDPEYFDVSSKDGEFHVKAGGIIYGQDIYFAVKESGCFFDNGRRYGLPNIYGLIVLCDARNAAPLAVLNAGPVTAKRTAAATAVAAKYLARPESTVITICGAGTQGTYQLLALACVLKLSRVFVYDIDQAVAVEYARRMELETQIEIEPVTYDALEGCIQRSDVLVTCTPSTEPYIREAFLPAGLFVSAIGSDNASKQELDSAIILHNKVVADSRYQSERIGEVHHCLKRFPTRPHPIYAEIGEIVTGVTAGRTDESEIIIFDATGIALQDVASAVRIYRSARARKVGTHFDFD